MSFFSKIFGKKEQFPEWDVVIQNGSVYPDESISLVTVETKSGIGTGWIDKSYLKYPYKTNCRYNILIEVDLSDDSTNSNMELDMAFIEDFFIDGLREKTIAHAVLRLVTDTAMKMEFYVDNKTDSENFLKSACDNPNRLFSFVYEISEDPWWLAVRPLLKMK